ncbi:MAG: ABC transporter ATP-binding protein [Alphaproteobacteria bacterium]|nr:MAG: ABC transporter ATP-binding protein [Alphaproteobacteria bacterium]
MTAAGAMLLSCSQVSKHFGALAAVNNLSFDVAEGEVLGIGGPNGAGKTTLFEVISGLNPATAGEVIFAGRPITRLSPERICHEGIARTFQLNAGFDSLTVRENVLVGAHFGREGRRLPGLRIDREAKARADAALAAVGLFDRADHLTENISVLDRKLLMIASALATQPRLLLMDEPVGGLTPREIDQVMAVVHGLKGQGVTVILIEHVMRFLVQLSTRVLIMHHGEKLYEGPPEGLARDAKVVEVYLGASAAQRLRDGRATAGERPA